MLPTIKPPVDPIWAKRLPVRILSEKEQKQKESDDAFFELMSTAQAENKAYRENKSIFQMLFGDLF